MGFDMCGISGVFSRCGDESIQKMMGMLTHRGNDDEFFLSGEGYSIGVNRLSIIDVEGGRQPLANEKGNVVVAQNGEIYNYPELMERLIKLGHTFKSQCDTEVLAHMYEQYGEVMPTQLNGMFAIALWDDKRKRGLLVRDRMGEKPLYYTENNGCLYFASEIKALLTLPFMERNINLEALHHYLSYKHVPCPMTIFQGIRMLQPSHYLVWESGKIQKDVCYWQPSYSGGQSMPEEEIVEELDRLLKLSVKRRLISDVPIGIFLSGGVDSSLVTAIAAGLSEKPVETFTLTYPSGIASVGKIKDQENARWVANKYGANHHEDVVRIKSFEDLFPKVIRSFDQPFAGVISTYILARQMAQFVKTGMTGDGADELFGSYLSHRLAKPIHSYNQFVQGGLSGVIRGEDVAPYQSDIPYLASLAEREDWKWRSKLFVFSDGEKYNLYSQDIVKSMKGFSSESHLGRYFEGLNGADPLNRILGAEFKGIFPDQVLEFSDKLSMAHTLELRAAYLDHEFVEFASRLPGDWKIRNGVSKYILKKVALKYLPEEFINRSKEGFILPVTEWFYWNLRSYVEDTLSETNLAKHGLFNIPYVKQLVNEFYNRGYDYRRGNKLLSLISFQVWYDNYLAKA